MFRPLALALFIILTNLACDKEKAKEVLPPIDPCDSLSLTFTSNIGLILFSNCTGTSCHISATTPGADITLDTYAEVFGEINKPGSCFLPSIERNNAFCVFMPFDLPRLNQGTIDMIACWISKGAPE